jgi:hypothetical protein
MIRDPGSERVVDLAASRRQSRPERMGVVPTLIFVIRWRLCAALLGVTHGLMWLARRVAPRPVE